MLEAALDWFSDRLYSCGKACSQNKYCWYDLGATSVWI